MFKQISKILFVLLLIGLSIVSGWGLEQRLQGEDEIRARALFSELRCVVCQNQSIDSSDADVARDLRQIVREQISAGKNDNQIRQFLVARYGDFILLKPRLSWATALLWGAPFALLIGGGLLAFLAINNRKTVEIPPLTAREEENLARILSERDHSS